MDVLPVDLDRLLTKLQEALEQNDLDRASELIRSLRSPDQAELFEGLDDHQRIALLPKLAPAQSADILEELEDSDALELFAALLDEDAVRIIGEMEPDELADLIGAAKPEVARAILTKLEDPEEIHPLLLHPNDSAGGLMTSEFLALRRRMTATDALRAIHAWKPDSEALHYLYVVDAVGVLQGMVSLRQLIVAEADSPLVEIMDPDVISVVTGTDQEEVARLMTRYDLVNLPVVDSDARLLGVITIDDIVDVLEEEATEDIQRFGGALPLDQPYLRTSVLSATRKRIGWLLLLFLTESLTGTVLRHFEHELQSVVALAFFVPLLIGTGGNAGSQTTSTLIRALAVGDIDMSDALRAWWHEMRVGLLLGVGMGVVAYTRALLWGTSALLALTVALTLSTLVVWANGLGSILPLIAARLGIDPTVVSGPVMSTLVDATGLFIYFSIARSVLGI
ncbi:MAG: magnesium transporter [Anaerolineales bacterium]|nr:MAG: magnesium transporter [Anaerolineales bacterium]